MQIKRLHINLPPRMKHTAHHDARAMAEAIANALTRNGGQATEINIPGHGQSGLTLATRVGEALPGPKGGRHGG